MKLLNIDEYRSYLKETFQLLYSGTEFPDYEQEEIDGTCDSCGKEVFLKVRATYFNNNTYGTIGSPGFFCLLFECPRCKRKRFVQTAWVLYKEQVQSKSSPDDSEEYDIEEKYEVYKLYSLPTQRDSYIYKDIPNTYNTLITTISEALFGMDHGKFVSSAIMFRRGIQIIAKDILGAKGKTLHSQLEWLKTNSNNLGIDLSELFHDNTKLIKDVGNQGAHPDDDLTLHNFTKDELDGLHDLFVIIVNEIFVKPEKLRQLKEDLKKSRKLKE
jgi:DNA-directed RNA polymerase subunit RPC12/RpoP